MPKVSTSYKPGQSGNPKGRPHTGDTLADILRGLMAEVPKTAKDKKTYKRLFMEAQLLAGLKNPEGSAAKNVLHYHDGMPTQKLEVEQVDIVKALNEIDDQKDEVATEASKQLNATRPKAPKQVVEVKPPVQNKR